MADKKITDLDAENIHSYTIGGAGASLRWGTSLNCISLGTSALWHMCDRGAFYPGSLSGRYRESNP